MLHTSKSELPHGVGKIRTHALNSWSEYASTGLAHASTIPDNKTDMVSFSGGGGGGGALASPAGILVLLVIIAVVAAVWWVFNR